MLCNQILKHLDYTLSKRDHYWIVITTNALKVQAQFVIKHNLNRISKIVVYYNLHCNCNYLLLLYKCKVGVYVL